jgi:hypothetical protein
MVRRETKEERERLLTGYERQNTLYTAIVAAALIRRRLKRPEGKKWKEPVPL